MRRKRPPAAKVLLGLSIVVAAAATLLLRGHLQRLEDRAAAAGPGTSVIVAARDLSRGSSIAPSDVDLARVPRRYAPPGTAASAAAVTGRTLAADVAAGEPITATRLAPPGGPVASLVPPGLRAVGVVVGVPPGPLAPGDRVDVLATYAGGQPHTETVVAEAEVLRVGRTDAVDPGVTTTVVVLVTPSDAERLAYARSFADLSVAVVSADEP